MPNFTPTFGDRDFTSADSYRTQSNLQADPLETLQSNFNQDYGTGTTQAGVALAVERYNYEGDNKLSPEDADKQTKEMGIDGLTFDQPISQAALSLQQVRQQDYLKNKEVIDNGSGFSNTTVGQLGVGLGTSFLDPLDFATNFVGGKAFEALGVGADALKGASIASRIGTRLVQGGVENTGIGAAQGGLNWYEANQEQRDFGSDDFVKSLAYGAIMGSLIHAGTGAIGDVATRAINEVNLSRIKDILPPNAQTEALQLSNQGVYNFNDILSIQPKVIVSEQFLGRELDQSERLKVLQGTPEEGLPTNEDLSTINPSDIAQEKVSRLKDLINGHEESTATAETNEEPKVTLSSEDITNGTIDDEQANLDKENADLKSQIDQAEPEEEKVATEGENAENQEPELRDHSPDYHPEVSDLISNSQKELDNANDAISQLPVRERAIKNAVGCFLGATTGD